MGNIYGSKGYVKGTLATSLTSILLMIGGFYAGSRVSGTAKVGFILGAFGALALAIGMFLMFLKYAIYGSDRPHSYIVYSMNKGRRYQPNGYDLLLTLFFIFTIPGIAMFVIGCILGFSNLG